ncbi:MAG: PKD domain-containing protein [FCB group bacterium]|jgi:PKD repeat protein
MKAIIISVLALLIQTTSILADSPWVLQYKDTTTSIYKTINTLFFKNDSIGWAVSRIQDSCFILKYNFNSSKWEKVYSTNEYIGSVFFLDKNKGWASGSVILHTNDGGKNWDIRHNFGRSDFSGGFSGGNSLFFLDSLNGFLPGLINEHYGEYFYLYLYNTIDGGYTWHEKLNLNPYPYCTLSDIIFLNKNIGYFLKVGEGIYKTTDGGLTWSELSDTQGFNSMSIPDQNNIWTLVVNTWTFHYDGNGNLINKNLLPPNVYWNKIFFINDKIGWIAGDSGRILHTTDAGKHWYKQRTNTTEGFTSIWFIDSLRGWIGTGESSIFYTSNGGVTLAANFDADTTKGMSDLTVHFTDYSIGNPKTWFWEFGDEGTSTLQNPVHVYKKTGLFSVKLTVSDSNNTDISFQKDLIKVLSVKANFTAEPTEGKAPLFVKFIDKSVGKPTFRYWPFGYDLIYRSKSNDTIVKVFEDPSLYYNYCELIIGDFSKGDSTNIDTLIVDNCITVTEKLAANFDTLKTEGILPLSVYFTDKSTGDIVNWYWSFGDGDSSNEASPIHIYKNAGIYDVSLKVEHNYYDYLNKFHEFSDTYKKQALIIIPIDNVNYNYDIPPNRIFVNIIQNNFSNSGVIQYYLTKPNRLRMSLINYLGQEIAFFYDEYCNEGKNTYNFDFKKYNLYHGIYFIKFECGNDIIVKKINIMQ